MGDMRTCKCEKYCAKTSRGREVLERFVPFIADFEYENYSQATLVRKRAIIFHLFVILCPEMCEV
jgi:hypothetical protein